MVKYREILRLAAMGVSQNSIAFSCGCAQSTVSDVLRAARAHQLSWPLPEEMDDAAIRAIIYPRESRKAKDRAAIDHEHIASELTRRGMTMSLLWNEYCDGAIARGEVPYMYSAFCREHRDWAQRHDVRMRIEHRAAEAIQVDWVGDAGEVIDPDTGEILKVYVFAACLPTRTTCTPRASTRPTRRRGSPPTCTCSRSSAGRPRSWCRTTARPR